MAPRRRSLFLLRLGVLLLALVVPTTPSAAAGSRVWNEQLQEVLAQLRGQRWPEALMSSQELLDSFGRSLAPGKNADRSVALVVMCRALAEAGQGREAEAVWDWQVAQQIDASIEDWSFAEFGAAGAVLDRHRRSRDPRPAVVDPLESKEIEPAQRIGEARFPAWPQAAYRSGWAGPIQVEAVVGADGGLSHPQLTQAPPVATMTLAAFDALRGNRFVPARRDGEPVPSLFRFTLKFSYTR